ncbi:MAG: GNAT family N-acetyltransferase [Oxalobacteraceae bacterium]|jgi:putative acetyltransferase|nr:GNAT family N-acetyltransferase [Oxalobacteraceae bacterium]
MINMSKLSFTIRRAEPRDANDFCTLMENQEVFPNLLQLPYPSEMVWLDRLSKKPEGGQLHLVAISNSQVVASAGIWPNEPIRRRHTCALGIAVASDYHGQGVGTALMSALVDFVDNWTTFLRVELNVFADNQVAISLYERFGFTREGVHRGYGLRYGHFQDVVSMARLHPNPPRIGD